MFDIIAEASSILTLTILVVAFAWHIRFRDLHSVFQLVFSIFIVGYALYHILFHHTGHHTGLDLLGLIHHLFDDIFLISVALLNTTCIKQKKCPKELLAKLSKKD